MFSNKILWKLNLVHYDNDPYDEIEEGSLLLTDWRSADALVEATVHAIQSGALKRVGELFTLDVEAFASPASFLKVNLGIRSLWAAGLLIGKRSNLNATTVYSCMHYHRH